MHFHRINEIRFVAEGGKAELNECADHTQTRHKQCMAIIG